MTATANDGGNTNSNSHDILVTVAEHADAPTLTVSDTSGTEDQPIALSISSTLVDALGAADPDESLSITITGIPPDATLSNTNGDTLTHPGGSITFTQAMLTAGVLTGLAITPTSADDPNFTLHVTATANDGGNTNSNSHDILVTVAEHADAPTLTVSDTSGTEDQPIALSISSTLVDALGAADPDESLSITITGIPPDATLSNTNGDTLTHPGGSITFTQAMLTAGVLTGLAITPTSADDPNSRCT